MINLDLHSFYPLPGFLQIAVQNLAEIENSIAVLNVLVADKTFGQSLESKYKIEALGVVQSSTQYVSNSLKAAAYLLRHTDTSAERLLNEWTGEQAVLAMALHRI